ncbi:MAG: hypothetical protein HZA95_03290 [Candidatus Vogelbacteria bacterium]|nr:hypothetical protein [Candidatus Vogelbacteria bacterium]
MIIKGEDKFMRLAIREARRSNHEDDSIHPYVGVVVVRDGEILASACRGDRGLGDHAEFTALEKKLKKDKLAGCTVYTTLEPCTTRNHPKVPCAERLIQRKVDRVVIGMLDPDQRITGKGILRLRRAGIAVDLFPKDMMAELEELNREFTKDREEKTCNSTPPGISESGITTFYPSRDFYGILRRDASTIDRYISKAEISVIMVSINLMTGLPFNDLCTCLRRKLKGNGCEFKATISLLNPNQSELISVVSPILNCEAIDLANSIRRSLKDLLIFKKSLPKHLHAHLDVRVHSVLPFGSAILLDHENKRKGKIQIETKPYKAGIQNSFAFEVMHLESGGFYDTLVSSYETLLTDGQSIEDGNI